MPFATRILHERPASPATSKLSPNTTKKKTQKQLAASGHDPLTDRRPLSITYHFSQFLPPILLPHIDHIRMPSTIICPRPLRLHLPRQNSRSGGRTRTPTSYSGFGDGFSFGFDVHEVQVGGGGRKDSMIRYVCNTSCVC